VPAETLFYQPETLTARELGLKSRFWDQRATLNVAAFDYRYSNLQLSGVAIVGGAPRFVTANAGQASVRGLEMDGAVRVTPRDRLTYAATLLDARYTRYTPDGAHSWAGHTLDRAPSSTFSIGYEHAFRLPGAVLTAGADARTSAAYVIGVPSQLLEYRIPRRTESDAHFGYQRDRSAWSLQARVRNLEGKVQPLAIDSFGMAVPSAPRSWDVRLNWRL
jgi:iron complex outermembrane receptor protein